jgi:hypothetical protein
VVAKRAEALTLEVCRNGRVGLRNSSGSSQIEHQEIHMATTFTVQSFQLKGRTLVPDPPKSSRTGDAAIELAERLATSKSGVVAFSQEVDIGTDTYDEPRVLCRIGSLPEGLFTEQ